MPNRYDDKYNCIEAVKNTSGGRDAGRGVAGSGGAFCCIGLCLCCSPLTSPIALLFPEIKHMKEEGINAPDIVLLLAKVGAVVPLTIVYKAAFSGEPILLNEDSNGTPIQDSEGNYQAAPANDAFTWAVAATAAVTTVAATDMAGRKIAKALSNTVIGDSIGSCYSASCNFIGSLWPSSSGKNSNDVEKNLNALGVGVGAGVGTGAGAGAGHPPINNTYN